MAVKRIRPILKVTIDANLQKKLRVYADKTNTPLSRCVENLLMLGFDRIESQFGTGGSVLDQDRKDVLLARDKLLLDPDTRQRW